MMTHKLVWPFIWLLLDLKHNQDRVMHVADEDAGQRIQGFI